MIKKRGIVLLIDEIDDVWMQLCKQAELNVLGVHEVIMEKPNSVQKVLNRLEEKPVREQLARFEKAGIEVEFELHAVEWLLPRSLFSAQPELFRQNNEGERVAENNCCVSNPVSLELLSERARVLAKLLNQTGHNHYYWMDDAENATCRCDECRCLSGADQNMKMMNAIAEGLTSADKNAKAAYLAYADALTVPNIKPHPSLFLEFAPIFRNHFEPITSGDPKNTKYRELLTALLKIFNPENAHILEYWLDNAFFSQYKKPPVKVPFDRKVTQSDVAFYRSLGIDFITCFGSYLGDDYRIQHGLPPISEYGEILKNQR